MSFVLKNSKRYHKSFKCYLVFELTTDAPALQGAQSDHKEKWQTIGRNKCKKLTSNTKKTKVALFQGILNVVLCFDNQCSP